MVGIGNPDIRNPIKLLNVACRSLDPGLFYSVDSKSSGYAIASGLHPEHFLSLLPGTFLENIR
jgi:hypothetical protein